MKTAHVRPSHKTGSRGSGGLQQGTAGLLRDKEEKGQDRFTRIARGTGKKEAQEEAKRVLGLPSEAN